MITAIITRIPGIRITGCTIDQSRAEIKQIIASAAYMAYWIPPVSDGAFFPVIFTYRSFITLYLLFICEFILPMYHEERKGNAFTLWGIQMPPGSSAQNSFSYA